MNKSVVEIHIVLQTCIVFLYEATLDLNTWGYEVVHIFEFDTVELCPYLFFFLF